MKPFSKGEDINEMIMKKTTMIDELKYRIKRYQEMGNGTMCQNLSKQLAKLVATN